MAVKAKPGRYRLGERFTVDRGIGIVISEGAFDNHPRRMNNFNVVTMDKFRDAAGKVLQAMGIADISGHTNNTKNQLLRQLRARAEFANLHDVDVIVIFMGSHGLADGTLATSDDFVHPFGDILSLFDDIHTFPNLVGKPKVFFIDACYGGLIDHHNPRRPIGKLGIMYMVGVNGQGQPISLYPDLWRVGRVNEKLVQVAPVEPEPPLAPAFVDCFVFRAAVPGHSELFTEERTSQFMRSLVRTFRDGNNNNMSLMELFLAAQRNLSEHVTRIRTYENYGFRGYITFVGSVLTTMTKDLIPCRIHKLK